MTEKMMDLFATDSPAFAWFSLFVSVFGSITALVLFTYVLVSM